MGLFSGKKTFYSSGVSREPLTDEYPDPHKMSIIQAILTGGDLVEAITAAERASFVYSADEYLRYGETTFDYGLPTSSESSGEINDANLLSVIESVAGQEVTIDRQELSLSNSGKSYAYSVEYSHKSEVADLQTRVSQANTLVTTTGNAVVALRNSILAVVFTSNANDTLALYESLLAAAEAAETISSADHSAIYSEIENSPTITNQETTNAASLAGYTATTTNNNISEVTAELATLQQEVVTIREFYYEIIDGTYPILSNTLDLTDRYMPVVPIKENGEYLKPQSSLYKTGNGLLSKLGMDVESFKDAVDNSDIATEDVVATFFSFTADLKTDDPVTLKYLFELWEKEAVANSISKIVTKDLLPNYIAGSYVNKAGAGPFGTIGQVFQSAAPPRVKTIDIKENTYDSHIGYSGISSFITRNKTIGAIGVVKSYVTLVPNGSYEVSLGLFGTRQTVGFDRNYITYEKQVTSNRTISVRVQGLSNITRVNPQEFTIASGQPGVSSGVTSLDGKRAAIVSASLTSDEPLYIPINYDLLQVFSSREKSEILVRSMSLILYWRNITVVKTGFFGSIFFKIVSIVIVAVLIYYGQADLANFIGNIASGTVSATQALITIGTNVAISVGVSMALQELAKIGGIFAVIAAVYMLYRFDVGGFATIADGTAMPWAEQLLKAVTLTANTMADTINEATAIGYELLIDESARFLMSAEAKEEEINNAKDLLGGSDNMYNPLLMLESTDQFISTESSTAFYNRALNTNPGVAALSYISSYVAIGVSLPEWNGLHQEDLNPNNL